MRRRTNMRLTFKSEKIHSRLWQFSAKFANSAQKTLNTLAYKADFAHEQTASDGLELLIARARGLKNVNVVETLAISNAR